MLYTEAASRIIFPYGITFDPETDRFNGPLGVHDRIIRYPLSVVFNTSHECNLRCEYCFRIGSEIPPPTTEQIFLFLNHLPVDKAFRIVLSGGEPFWRKDIYEVIKFCCFQPWHVIIVSNGTWPIDFGKIPSRVRFEFSLDAPNAEIYAKARGGTPKQYTQLVANIEEAVRRGYRVRPCYLMSRINTSKEIMADIVRFSASLGVTQMRLQRFKPWGGGEHFAWKYEFAQEEYRKICSFARTEALKFGNLQVIVPQNNRFLVIGSLYVYPNGNIAIQEKDCGEQLKLGNLYKETLEKIWSRVKKQYSKLHLEWLISPKRLL